MNEGRTSKKKSGPQTRNRTLAVVGVMAEATPAPRATAFQLANASIVHDLRRYQEILDGREFAALAAIARLELERLAA